MKDCLTCWYYRGRTYYLDRRLLSSRDTSHEWGIFKRGGGDRKSFATVALEIEEKLISTWSCKCTMCRRK